VEHLKQHLLSSPSKAEQQTIVYNEPNTRTHPRQPLLASSIPPIGEHLLQSTIKTMFSHKVYSCVLDIEGGDPSIMGRDDSQKHSVL